MKTSTIRQFLEEKIEELVRTEMMGIRASVAAAVERGLSATSSSRRQPEQRRSRARAQSKRRTDDEVAQLVERLLAAVNANPGQTMATLASETGATPRELRVPVVKLKQAGRLRLVGQRQYTTYFPGIAPSA